MSTEEELARALALSLGQEPEPAAAALPEGVVVAETAPPAPTLEVRLMEICGCTAAEAAQAVRAAGPGGLSVAIDIVLSMASQKPTKMVCLVRQDLGMGAGKVAAQVTHGALGAYRRCAQASPQSLQAWAANGEACIVLQVGGLEDLDSFLASAESKGLITFSVTDAGRTQVAAGTRTVGCIGPGPVDVIDSVTGHLALLA